MTEPLAAASGADAAGPRTAGALLKAAREREGLHLAVLAATIKVSPAKLQALEQDRYDQLPNATFTRALAQSVCRSLKVDPRPVLALLPQLEALPLEGVTGRLNTPFQDRPSRSDGAGLAWASKPMFWAGGLLLVAALVVGLVPTDLVERWATRALSTASAPASAPTLAVVTPPPAAPGSAASEPAAERLSALPAASAALADPTAASAPAPAGAASAPAPAGAASAPAPAGAASVAVAETVAAAPSSRPLPAPAAGMPPVAGPGVLRLTASADSWIEVLDAQGQPVFSRILARGEAVAVDAPPPLRVRVGNAAGTSVAFRGQAFDLGPYTRDNVARLELR